MAKPQERAKKVEPFKARKTRVVETKIEDTITPPAEIARAIDAFRECQEQAKHFEGEATVHKDAILDFSEGEYVKRALAGMNRSFKVLGDQSMVTYVVSDFSAGLTEEEMEEFAKKWGEKAADDLITRDFGSIRFDADVLEANYDEVVKALQVLPNEVLENLFKPMLMRAKPGAVEIAKRYAKTPKEFRGLLKQLKMKNYIK